MEIAYARLLHDIICTIAACRDLGTVAASDPRLAARPRCDLCYAKASTGRLLAGRHGLGWKADPDDVEGTVRFKPWRVTAGEEQHAMYWVCSPCYEDLRTNRARLLERLIEETQS